MKTTFDLAEKRSRLDLPLPTAIVGMGLTGRSVQNLLSTLGIPKDQVFLFDAKDPVAEFQDPTALLKMNPKSLIVSPGVPLASTWIQDYRAAGGFITSELTLATSFFTTEKLVGITGSIGKSTCTALLQAGLQKFSPDSFVGGNLGYPLADYILRKIQGGPTAEWVVLELSSYQLENYQNLCCVGSIITYLTANHMERYPSLNDYYESKWHLVNRTRGPVILNQKGGDLSNFAKLKTGSFHWASPDQPEFASIDFSKAQLVGDHNRDNLALVITLARELGWDQKCLDGFFGFTGLPHRLENLGLIDGVRYINDSKATTIESVIQAVKSTESLARKKLHLLLGGKDKNLPWADLQQLTQASNRQFYFFGAVRDHAQEQSGLPGPTFESLGPAVAAAQAAAKDGELVLLSPGGTSLDEFKSFEVRGDFFRNRISKR